MASKKPDAFTVVTKPNGELVLQLEDNPKDRAKAGTKRAASGNGGPQPSSSKASKMLSVDEKVNKLEKAIVKAKSRMPDYENEEMLEKMDDENNSYIKLAKGFMAVLDAEKRAAKLRGERIVPYKHMMHRIHLKATEYPELRSAVEDFVNKSKAVDAIVFENILEVVNNMNEKRESPYGGKQKLRDLAFSLFEEANNIIKDRRKEELYGAALDYAELEKGESATLNEDPGLTDEALKAQLEENAKQRVIDLEQIRARLAEEDGGSSEQDDVDEEDYDESKDAEYVNEKDLDQDAYDPDMLADSDLDDDEDPTRDQVEESETSEEEVGGILVRNGEEVHDGVNEQNEDTEEPAAEVEDADERSDSNHSGVPAPAVPLVELNDSSSSEDDCQIVSD